MTNEEIAMHDVDKIREFHATGRLLHLVGFTLDVATWFKRASEQTSTPMNFKEALALAVEFMRYSE